MELAPTAKPAVLGLNDLSKLKVVNFDPRDAFRKAKYTCDEARRHAKKHGLILKVSFDVNVNFLKKITDDDTQNLQH
jgi:hypothetical protein